MECTTSSLVLGLLLATGAAAGQTPQTAPSTQGTCTFTDESGKVVTLPNCGVPDAPGGAPPPPSQAAPGAARDFPYPGEGGSSAGANSPAAPVPAPVPVQGPANPGSAAPAGSPGSGGSNGSNNPNGSAGQRFPFPGEDSNPPAAGNAKPASPGGLQDAGSSGSSSSSSGSSSSSNGAGSSDSSDSSSSSSSDGAGPLAGDNDASAKAAADRHRSKLAAPRPPQSDIDREQEDIRVAGFYQSDADYKGAYTRAKDAVSLADEDAAAHLALADAARKLGKLDEAETNYKKCLVLDPVPKVKKAAEKALKELQGGE